MKSIADLRKSYELGQLDEDGSTEDPLKLFDTWLQEALVNKLPEMLPKYYEIRGWDTEGRLKPETRERLGL